MTVLFTGIVLWAYSGKRARAFAEAEMLPFADEPRATGEKELPR
jgi:cytochrome c oxidase cbb3-type subunit 4